MIKSARPGRRKKRERAYERITLEIRPDLLAEVDAEVERQSTSRRAIIEAALVDWFKPKPYTVAYEVGLGGEQVVAGEMEVSAISESRALEVAAHVLDEQYQESVLLSCEIKERNVQP